MALPRTYESLDCSVARALEVIGDRWTLLVIRSAFQGVRRFDDFQETLGIARNVLADRLTRLCDEGLLRRVPYQERPERHEYRLTRKGVELWPALVSLMLWGDRYYAPDGPPVLVSHKGCDGHVADGLVCSSCGRALEPHEVEPVPGPGVRG
ncbi:winged helix-turn-helix transcriptional regulator [Actinomadura kijaniata]|uniref:winged helix-turn-helix transcriptional regulator n=1 Tax=Actinomadura kijaniata TaxID=46161 RepID=UPI000832D46C|nr:helix-turn-helix domain-containing protein [Actinomadura kijaniata]